MLNANPNLHCPVLSLLVCLRVGVLLGAYAATCKQGKAALVSQGYGGIRVSGIGYHDIGRSGGVARGGQ